MWETIVIGLLAWLADLRCCGCSIRLSKRSLKGGTCIECGKKLNIKREWGDR